MAGTLGSYALLGMMFGALLAGAFGDILGRRKVMLISYAWFSVGMFITALMSTTTTFGVMRFITGLEFEDRGTHELKGLDKVAYVRFASVYRHFRDVGEFMTELRDLLGAKE